MLILIYTITSQLGDGAAMYLGEAIRSIDTTSTTYSATSSTTTTTSTETERYELQLKGAGLTPCSRSGMFS